MWRRTRIRKVVFARRDRELLRSIARGDGLEKMKRIAEKVRESKLQVLKAERDELSPATEYFDTKRAANIDAETERWMSMPFEDIIAEYRNNIQAGN